MPPVITGSKPVPSGRQRKIWAALVFHSLAVHDVRLLGERAFAPIDPAVGPGVRAMQVVRAAGERFALEPFDALVGDAVAIFVGEFPDAGRSGDIERAVEEQRPSGNIMWSANTVRLSNLPSPSVSSSRTMRCGFSSSCFCTGSFEPDDSATYSRPSSSNEATIGRSTSGGPAASSIENPLGTFGRGGELGALSAARIDRPTEDRCQKTGEKQGPNRHAATPTTLCDVSLEYNLATPIIQPLSFGYWPRWR